MTTSLLFRGRPHKLLVEHVHVEPGNRSSNCFAKDAYFVDSSIMKLSCSHCQVVHEYNDKRPAFCSACGHAYPPSFPEATRSLDLEATGPDHSQPADATVTVPRTIGGYRLLLLDWPLHATGPQPSTEAGSANAQSLLLLRRVAVLTLEGKPRPAFAPVKPIQARMPLHAAAMTARLVGAENPYTTLEELQAELNNTHDKPTGIHWLRLAAYVAVETVLLYSGIMYLPMLMLLTKESEVPPGENSGCAQFVAFLTLLKGLYLSAFLCPPLVILIALLMRGGVGMHFMELVLVNRRGQPVRRWRCALRALLTWVQLVAIAAVPTVGTFLLAGIPYPIYQSWAAIVLYFHLLVYALLGEMLLAWLPGRSLADRLCGTHLVPK